MSCRCTHWMATLKNMTALAAVMLMAVVFNSNAYAAQFVDDPTINIADTIVFVSVAQLIDSVSKDAIAVDRRYLREVAEIDSIIRYKFNQKLGAGVRFDGTSQDDILEPTFYLGFRTYW